MGYHLDTTVTICRFRATRKGPIKWHEIDKNVLNAPLSLLDETTDFFRSRIDFATLLEKGAAP